MDDYVYMTLMECIWLIGEKCAYKGYISWEHMISEIDGLGVKGDECECEFLKSIQNGN